MWKWLRNTSQMYVFGFEAAFWVELANALESGKFQLDPLLPVSFCGSSMQPSEILATKTNFVRTASNGGDEERFGSSNHALGPKLPVHNCEEPVTWQQAMKRAVRSTTRLRDLLGLEADPDLAGEPDFPTFVPLEFLSRIRAGDPADPLLRQVLVTSAEQEQVPGFDSDPVGDLNAQAAPGMLHKYNGRALMISTGACGVHCRYCFRREYPYSQAGGSADNSDRALEYLQREDSIHEAILSGGDPLTLTDEKLFRLIDRIESIGHVRRLRIHSRMPVVIPQRVTQALAERLRSSRLTVWMVIHANHANELDSAVINATDQLVDAGIPLLNQAVLLRGVNDDIESLAELCAKLVDCRIQPYYLHQLDRVRGAAHFEVSREKGLRLIESLREKLPGYAVPKYVHEDPGEPSKTSLA